MAQLLRAAAHGDLEKVTALRSSWGFQNKKGESVLHVAVAEGQLNIVQHLVANGAMLNLQDKKHRFTPLMLALAQQPPSFQDIIEALLKGKPDLNLHNSSGQTVVHLAAEYEELEILKLLLSSKANVDAADTENMTALHVAVGKGSLDIVRLLLETGRANVNVVDSKGNTPLHWACIKICDDQLELINYLISKGAKPLKNVHGHTPLHSEAMHCDPTAAWPTAAAETFEQGIDSEELAKPSLAKPSNEERQRERRGKSDDNEKYQDGAAAARAAAIAYSKKKKTPKASKEGSSMAPYMWAALVFAILAVLNAVFSSYS